jgi:hypothetical protein
VTSSGGGAPSSIRSIYRRSFADSDGDGIGDLRGIITRLEPPVRLGVDALWLSRSPSPMADFGYDIADQTDIDPRFGTLADFDDLVARAHARPAEGRPSTTCPRTRPTATRGWRRPARRATIRGATGTCGGIPARWRTAQQLDEPVRRCPAWTFDASLVLLLTARGTPVLYTATRSRSATPPSHSTASRIHGQARSHADT